MKAFSVGAAKNGFIVNTMGASYSDDTQYVFTDWSDVSDWVKNNEVKFETENVQ